MFPLHPTYKPNNQRLPRTLSYSEPIPNQGHRSPLSYKPSVDLIGSPIVHAPHIWTTRSDDGVVEMWKRGCATPCHPQFEKCYGDPDNRCWWDDPPKAKGENALNVAGTVEERNEGEEEHIVQPETEIITEEEVEEAPAKMGRNAKAKSEKRDAQKGDPRGYETWVEGEAQD